MDRAPPLVHLAARAALVLLVISAVPDLVADPTAPRRVERSEDEVRELIRTQGRKRPEWWSDVRLEYPDTLDLSWPKAEGPWNTRKNVGQYVWSVINENPSRWQQGTKFLHYVLAKNKSRAAARKKAVGALAHCYHDLLQDYARAAYWLLKAESRGVLQTISLANCYWRLGNKELAVEQLEKIRRDRTRYGSAIKLWSDMGEIDRALRLAAGSAGRSGAYMGAGDACRKHGRYGRAIAYYEKVLKLKGKKDDGILNLNKKRARINIDMIRAFDALDLAKIPDGTYEATTLSFAGDMSVAVDVRQARIERVRVTKHVDKQYYSALHDVPAQIVARQGLEGVDATTGATITAQAIINATAKALGGVGG